MADNPLSSRSAGTLDEAVIRPENETPRFGWRWWVCCLYILALAVMTFLLIDAQAVEYALDFHFTALGGEPVFYASMFMLTAGLLLFFRTQLGWVMATAIVSGMIVLSTIGFVVQFIPAIEPVRTGQWGRLASSTISIGLACFVFYLLSHPRLRAGFRIPQSWIRRCVTLGGFVGTGIGMWLIWMATRLIGAAPF